jgi:recombination protein RecA
MQSQAAVLKREIEAKLANRIPAALSPIALQMPRLHPIGNAPLDSLLGGGLPFGSVCELTGPDGSGRSSVALSLLASASKEGACAYIDVSDTLSPQSAAGAAVELANLLWVRFATATQLQVRSAKSSVDSKPFEVGSGSRRPIHGGCGSSHPRGETKGLAPALEQMLFDKEERRRRKMEGTPGHPNQPLGLHTASQDQVEWERWNLRRVDETDPLRQMDRQAAEAARARAGSTSPAVTARVRDGKPWDRLNQALRATDQVLQSGGFRVVVLDLASVAPQEALRIPSATWFRYRRAAQESDAILLLLTREPCARSSAACVLECSVGESPKIRGVLTAASRIAEVARQRTGPAFGRKAPGRATSWEAAPAWMWAAGR